MYASGHARLADAAKTDARSSGKDALQSLARLTIVRVCMRSALSWTPRRRAFSAVHSIGRWLAASGYGIKSR